MTFLGGATVSFKYDPFGKRIYKASPSGTSIYAYDGDNLTEETNAAGVVVARYSQDLDLDDPLAQVRSGATSFYEADGLGSVTSLKPGDRRDVFSHFFLAKTGAHPVCYPQQLSDARLFAEPIAAAWIAPPPR